MKKLLLFFVLSVFVQSGYALELGLHSAKFWTTNYEIRNPFGYGFYIYQEIGKVGAKVEYSISGSERNFSGLMYGGFMLYPEDQIIQPIKSKSEYTSLDLSLVFPKIFSYEMTILNIGIGLSYNKFNVERIGETTQKKFIDNDNKLGFFYALSVSQQNIFNTPVNISIQFKHKLLSSGNYTLDVETPFSNLKDIKELQLSIGYMFSMKK